MYGAAFVTYVRFVIVSTHMFSCDLTHKKTLKKCRFGLANVRPMCLDTYMSKNENKENEMKTLTAAQTLQMLEVGFTADEVAAMRLCACGSTEEFAMYTTPKGLVCGTCWEMGHWM